MDRRLVKLLEYKEKTKYFASHLTTDIIIIILLKQYEYPMTLGNLL